MASRVNLIPAISCSNWQISQPALAHTFLNNSNNPPTTHRHQRVSRISTPALSIVAAFCEIMSANLSQTKIYAALESLSADCSADVALSSKSDEASQLKVAIPCSMASSSWTWPCCFSRANSTCFLAWETRRFTLPSTLERMFQ